MSGENGHFVWGYRRPLLSRGEEITGGEWFIESSLPINSYFHPQLNVQKNIFQVSEQASEFDKELDEVKEQVSLLLVWHFSFECYFATKKRSCFCAFIRVKRNQEFWITAFVKKKGQLLLSVPNTWIPIDFHYKGERYKWVEMFICYFKTLNAIH